VFLKFTAPASGSFVHGFVQQVAQFVTSLLKPLDSSKLNYGALLGSLRLSFSWRLLSSGKESATGILVLPPGL
jgi:hypothetical protein